MFEEDGPTNSYNRRDIDPLREINTKENLELRDKALTIHSKGPVERLSLDEMIEMLQLFHLSIGELQHEADQIPDEIRIIHYVREHYPDVTTLMEFRNLFSDRVFPDELVAKWVNSSANIRALTAGCLMRGYPEYIISTTPTPYRSGPDMLEYFRRKFIDDDPNAEDFLGIYDDPGS